MIESQLAALASAPFYVSMLVDLSSHPDVPPGSYAKRAPAIAFTADSTVIDAFSPTTTLVRVTSGRIRFEGSICIGCIVLDLDGYLLYSVFDAADTSILALIKQARDTGKMTFCLVDRRNRQRFIVACVEQDTFGEVLLELEGKVAPLERHRFMEYAAAVAAWAETGNPAAYEPSGEIRGIFGCPLFRLTVFTPASRVESPVIH